MMNVTWYPATLCSARESVIDCIINLFDGQVVEKVNDML